MSIRSVRSLLAQVSVHYLVPVPLQEVQEVSPLAPQLKQVYGSLLVAPVPPQFPHLSFPVPLQELHFAIVAVSTKQ